MLKLTLKKGIFDAKQLKGMISKSGAEILNLVIWCGARLGHASDYYHKTSRRHVNCLPREDITVKGFRVVSSTPEASSTVLF